jgi:hypothetical protein
VSASGTPLKTSAESAAERRLVNSSTKINSNAIGTTIAKRWDADANCSNWPPQVIK